MSGQANAGASSLANSVPMGETSQLLPISSADTPSRAPSIGGSTRPDFAVIVSRWRAALLASRLLDANQVRVALVMLDATNRKRWADKGELVSWLGEATVAARAGMTPSTARRHRETLRSGFRLVTALGRPRRQVSSRLEGHAVVFRRLRGRGASAEYEFDLAWLRLAEDGLSRDRDGDDEGYRQHELADDDRSNLSGQADDSRPSLGVQTVGGSSCPPKFERLPAQVCADARSNLSPDLLEDLSEDLKESRASELQREFDQTFWPEYPLKVAKPAAAKAWSKARRSAELAEIMDGLKLYKAGKPDWRQWAHAANWLNGERWRDEDMAQSVAGAASSPDREIERAIEWLQRGLRSPAEPAEHKIAGWVGAGKIKIELAAAYFSYADPSQFIARWSLSAPPSPLKEMHAREKVPLEPRSKRRMS